ncbi:MAG: SOSS complex subunit B family protein [Armatimonadota bacterium]
MQIKDLQAKQGNVDVIVDVIDVSEPREFQKFGKTGKVATAIVKDETGDCKLSLWNEDTEKVKSGDKIHITNGYVSEWQGEIQLTTGRMGKIEVVKEGDKEIKKDKEGEKHEFEGAAEKEEELSEEPVTDEEEIE